jgi:hypothetical protein
MLLRKVLDYESVDRNAIFEDGRCGCAVPYALQKGPVEAYAFLVAGGCVFGSSRVAVGGLEDPR